MEFIAGGDEIHNEQRSGRSPISDETVEKIEETLCEDRWITLGDLCILVPEVSRSTIHRILTENFTISEGFCSMGSTKADRISQQKHVDSSFELFHRCADSEDFLDSIVT